MDRPIGFGTAPAPEGIAHAVRGDLFVLPWETGVQGTGFVLVGAVLGIDAAGTIALSPIRRARDPFGAAAAVLLRSDVEGCLLVNGRHPVDAARWNAEALRHRSDTGSDMTRQLTLCLLAICLCSHPSHAQERRTRMWNLTGDTVTEFRLAPAGTDRFGPDQCANDRDGTVDYDERLRIVGVETGRYDAQLRTKHGLSCTVRDVEVVVGDIFSIEEKDLKECHR